jgi:ATP-dependent DNA helicase RecG
MITLEVLNRWLSVPENEHIEFKEAHNNFNTEKLMRYCVALANEKGGYLVLGVTDKLPRKVVGTKVFPNIEDVKMRIVSQLHFRVEITELSHEDGRVLVFQIPSRPIGHPYHVDGAYLMRAGESLVPMTQDQLRRIFAEGKSDFLNHDATGKLSPDKVIAALDVQTFFDLMKLALPATREAILDRLISEKFVRAENGDFYITNLGAILLAKDLAGFDSLKNKTVRVIKYKGNNKIETERDHINREGYAVGFEELIGYINSQLPMNEIIGKALRREVRMYPELVIRELVANALIHQDLDQAGASLMVDIYSDRIEITNPGQPLIEVERFVDAYRSRNETLSDIMRRMGICEKKGSGIDKVVLYTEEYQLPAHDVRISSLCTTVVLFAYKEFKLMDMTDRLRACYLHCCLKYVSNERMTNQSLRERFKLDDTRAKTGIVSQIIAAAAERGDIKVDDPANTSKRYAKYIPSWA